MTDIDLMSAEVNSHIDDICRCAYLVALGDSEFSESEADSLSEVRAYCRKFFAARPAMEILEATGDIKKARELFDSDFPLIHSAESIFGSYLTEVQEPLSQVSYIDSYLDLVDRYASRITDRYLQLVAAFAAERVAKADDDFNLIEKRMFMRLFESWDVTYQEYEYWFAKFASAIVFGHFYDKDLTIDQFLKEDDSEEDEEDRGALLNELFGVSSLEELIEARAEEEDLPEIFQAVVSNELESVTKIIADGTDPDLKTTISGIAGMTPLMIAADRGLFEIAALLLERGADPNAVTDEHGYTPLLWAIKGEDERTVNLLLEKGAEIEPFPDGEADLSPLAMAAEHLLPDTTQALLARGASVNWRDPGGATPLKRACNCDESEASLKTLELLLQHGADPNLHDDEGFYPIHNAIDRGNIETTRLLLDAGVPIDLQFPAVADEDGSLLNRACLSVSPEVIRLILERLPEEKWTDRKEPTFLVYDEDGNPSVDDDEGFELIADTLRAGLKQQEDIFNVEESVRALCEAGVKPDLIGLCFGFLYPDLAKTLIPYCKDDLAKLMSAHPQIALAYVYALANNVEDSLRYFSGAKDLWFHATQALVSCGIDVPEGLEISEELDEDDEEESDVTEAFIEAVLDEVEKMGGDRMQAVFSMISGVGVPTGSTEELIGKSEVEYAELVKQAAEAIVAAEGESDEDDDQPGR